MRRLVIASLSTLLGIGSLVPVAASAADQPFVRRVSVGGFAGFQGFADKSGLGNAFDPKDTPQSGPTFGLRVSVPLIEMLAFDAEIAFTPTTLPVPPEVSASVLGLRALLRFAPMRMGAMEPYVSAGFGQAILSGDKFFDGTKQPSVKSPDVDNTFLVGVGANYEFSYRGSARIDARWVGGDVRPGDSGLANGFEVLIGASYALGGPPEDGDNDGVPDETDKCPDQAEDKDGFEDTDGCPELDNDGDGVVDAADKCPNELEDKDGFEDDDGCPDLDNDKDGVPDMQDKCPLQAEDKDGFQDADGCPDLDDDGDGIPDTKDKCPKVKEDKDGFEDDDGCPDLDNDKDGVPDAKDKCPNEAEVVNGFQDEDGCADALAPDVAPLFTGPVKGLKFKGAKLDKSAAKVLEKLLELLLEFESVKIEVHVHTAGKAPEPEKALAQQRAEAIRAFFVEAGIDEGRFMLMAHGAEQPLSTATGKKAWAENERVEFRIHTAPSRPGK